MMTTTMDDTLDRMIDSSFGGSSNDNIKNNSTVTVSLTEEPKDHSPFIPSKTFNGQKIGYYFGTSDGRTGYYLDINNPNNGNNSNKRKLLSISSDGNSDTNNKKRKKGVRIAEGNNEIRIYDNEDENRRQKQQQPKKKSGNELLKEIEDEQSSSMGGPKPKIITDMTTNGIRVCINNLQRIVNKNSLQRAQYSDNPTKYMNSELSLHDTIVSFKSIAAYINDHKKLYDPLFGAEKNHESDSNSSTNLIQLFHTLLLHENIDISTSVINVLVELVDPSLLVPPSSSDDEDNKEEDLLLINHPVSKLALSCIVGTPNSSSSSTTNSKTIPPQDNSNNDEQQSSQNQILDLIIANLERLQKCSDGDDNDISAIEDILTFIENIIDIDTAIINNDGSNGLLSSSSSMPKSLSVAAIIIKKTSLLSWLITKSTTFNISQHTNDIM